MRANPLFGGRAAVGSVAGQIAGAALVAVVFRLKQGPGAKLGDLSEADRRRAKLVSYAVETIGAGTGALLAGAPDERVGGSVGAVAGLGAHFVWQALAAPLAPHHHIAYRVLVIASKFVSASLGAAIGSSIQRA